MLLREKADQAEALLRETGLGCWLTFARETDIHPDPGVELVVGDQPVDVSVLLRARSIEIVGHEEDLECPAATDQAG